MIEREFQKGEVIFKEGQVGQCMYQVLEGGVAVFLGYGTPNEKKLTELEAGRIFGEMAVLEAWPRSATVAASKDHTKLLEIGTGDVSIWLREEPERIKEILNNLGRRLRELTQDYTEVCRTIREMQETRGETGARGKSLLDQISRFLGVAAFFRGKETVLEELERKAGSRQDGERQEESTDIRCKKNQVIFRQGEEASSMFMVKWGRVGIYTGYGTPDEKLLARVLEEQFFGEMGLIGKQPRSATAVALDPDTVITMITEEGTEKMFTENPVRSLMLLQHLSARLRALTKDYVKACRTLSDLHDSEMNDRDLTPEELAMVNYYTALATAMVPYY